MRAGTESPGSCVVKAPLWGGGCVCVWGRTTLGPLPAPIDPPPPHSISLPLPGFGRAEQSGRAGGSVGGPGLARRERAGGRLGPRPRPGPSPGPDEAGEARGPARASAVAQSSRARGASVLDVSGGRAQLREKIEGGSRSRGGSGPRARGPLPGLTPRLGPPPRPAPDAPPWTGLGGPGRRPVPAAGDEASTPRPALHWLRTECTVRPRRVLIGCIASGSFPSLRARTLSVGPFRGPALGGAIRFGDDPGISAWDFAEEWDGHGEGRRRGRRFSGRNYLK